MWNLNLVSRWPLDENIPETIVNLSVSCISTNGKLRFSCWEIRCYLLIEELVFQWTNSSHMIKDNLVVMRYNFRWNFQQNAELGIFSIIDCRNKSNQKRFSHYRNKSITRGILTINLLMHVMDFCTSASEQARKNYLIRRWCTTSTDKVFFSGLYEFVRCMGTCFSSFLLRGTTFVTSCFPPLLM